MLNEFWMYVGGSAFGVLLMLYLIRHWLCELYYRLRGSREQRFMRALTKLSMKHGIIISGCGCHKSPFLIVLEEEMRGYYDFGETKELDFILTEGFDENNQGADEPVDFEEFDEPDEPEDKNTVVIHPSPGLEIPHGDDDEKK